MGDREPEVLSGRVAGGLLAVLLLVAAVLRFHDVNWDLFRQLHPDERAIAMFANGLALPPDWQNLLDPEKSTLNPHFFAYGSFTIYLLRLASEAAGLVNSLWGQYEYMNLVGRVISALFDLGTITVVYFLGRRLYGRVAGLLAAAFVTFTALHVQLAHIYAADTPMTFWIVVGVFLADRLRTNLRLRDAVYLGAALGMALSFKFSAMPALVLVPAALALALFWRDDGWRTLRVPSAAEVNKAIGLALVAFACAGLVAVLLQPYLVLDFATYSRHIAEQNAMSRGTADLPYTRQFVGTTPYLYQLQNMVVWAYGPVLGLGVVAGWLYIVARSVKRPRHSDLLLLAWVIPYFLIVGSFHAKFMRYMLPIMPVLSLFLAVALRDLYRWRRAQTAEATGSADARVAGENATVELATDGGESVVAEGANARSSRGRAALGISPSGLAVAAGALVLTAGIVYTVAFMRVYEGEHTRVQASRWIFDNVPPQSALTHEHWDDLLPLPIDHAGRFQTADQYQMLEMRLYDPDDGKKLDHIVDTLTRADYVVLSSNRLYGSILRSPQRYPITTRYYEQLFAGNLGFSLVQTFTAYPGIGGWEIVDDGADESFTVYDHPKVLIFAKTAQLSEAELRERLIPPTAASPAAPAVARLMSDEQRSINLAGGTYRELFGFEFSSVLALVWWSLVIVLIGLAALPVVTVAFRALPDRGYIFGRILGILLLTYVYWIVVSSGLARGTQTTLYAVAGILAAASALAAWRWRDELRALWREKRGVILTEEALFWAAFLFLVGVRALNPDLWHPARGGEKPMDLAYLMAAIKSESFPPYDPWFAGGYLNYYYFGQMIVGTLMKLAGIAPTIAYNLAVPLLYAATIGGAFSVAYNLSALLGGNGGRRDTVAGLAAALLVGVAGNLAGAGQLVDGLRQVAGTNLRSNIPGLEAAVAVPVALWQMLVGGKPFPGGSDWYWASTRVYPGASVNEFPYFTFLFADLHAHMIALPYTLAGLAAAVTIVAGAFRSGKATGFSLDVATLLRWLLIALILGALPAINTWDFPTYLGLAIAALGVVWFRGERSWRAFALQAGKALLLVVASVSLYLPFHANFQSFYFGLDPSPEKSPLHLYLVINGLFVFILFGYIAFDFWRQHRGAGWLRTGALALRYWERLPRFVRLYQVRVKRDDEAGWLGLVALLLLLAGGIALHILGWTTLAFLALPLLLTLWLALVMRRTPMETLFLGLVAVGLALGIFCEVFAIKGDIGRMNTVFKFYLQVWIIWGVVAGVVLARALTAATFAKWSWGRAWLGVTALLVAASLVYPVVATPLRTFDRFTPGLPLTLDGTQYMRQAVYNDEGRDLVLANDLEAIRWLWQNVDGSPVILEGWSPYYRWGARVSIYTGLPTVIGWDSHQRQQRWGYQQEVDLRVSQVQAAYSSVEPAAALDVIERYGVSYVYVGELERAYYPVEGLAKFDAMVGSTLDLVYDANGVKIYRVRA